MRVDAKATIYGLTSIDLKALRGADLVVFRRRRDGRAFIECTKKIDRKSPWEDDERIHDIPVHAEIRNAPSDAEAFCMLHGCRYNAEWQTIASLLRVGDQLELEFWADYYQESNIYVDSLRLYVRRGEKRMVFLVSVEAAAYELSRMIRC